VLEEDIFFDLCYLLTDILHLSSVAEMGIQKHQHEEQEILILILWSPVISLGDCVAF